MKTAYDNRAISASRELLLKVSSPNWWEVLPAHCLTPVHQHGLRRLLGIEGVVLKANVSVVAECLRQWPADTQGNQRLIRALCACMVQNTDAHAELNGEPSVVMLQVAALLVNMATTAHEQNNSLFMLNDLLYRWWCTDPLIFPARDHLGNMFTGVRFVTGLEPLEPMLFRRTYNRLVVYNER